MKIRVLLPAVALSALAACTVQFGAPSPSVPKTTQAERTSGDPASGAPVDGSGAVLEERLLANGMLEIGKANAPHSIVLFTNYGCDYCRRFETEAMPTLLAEVAKGTLRIAITPLDLRKYADSDQAARLLLCAAQQKKGKTMHTFLFSKPTNPALMQKQIGTLGLNAATLSSCLQSPEFNTTRSVQQATARAFNVTLVPSYFIDGTQYVGLPDAATLQWQLQRALTSR